MPWLLSGRALEYRIGGEKRRALANAVVEVGYDDAAGPDDIGYCNQFDQRESYNKGSNTGQFGPYRPVEPGTADDYDEGVSDFFGPGFRANLVEQFVKRKAQGCRCVELDNPDAYTVDQDCSALDLARDYGFEVAGKNPNAIEGDPLRYVKHAAVGGLIFENDPNLTVAWAHALRVRAGKPDLPLRFVTFDDGEGGREFAERIAAEARAGNYADVGVTYDSASDEYGGEIEHLLIPRVARPLPPIGPIVMPTMLILRGIANDDHPRGQLDDASALEYARRRGYVGRVLDIAGSTAGAASDRPQVQQAIAAFRADPNIKAFYGFSGGGYNLRPILNALTPTEKSRIDLVAVLGSPPVGNDRQPTKESFEGPWELVYRLDPPAGHMAGPAALLAETASPNTTSPPMVDAAAPWLATMKAITGTLESPGAADNPVIMAWCQEIARRFPEMATYCRNYTHDSIPWCGLTVAYVMAVNGIRPMFGPGDTDKFLWAASWLKFGKRLAKPQLGCVMVFTREGGGHVSLYEGEDAERYKIRGGNQSDSVNVTWISKSQFAGAVWPDGVALPQPTADPVPVSAAHPLIMLGASGAPVIELQSRLGIAPTGIFDQTTDAAVREYQSAHGLDVDGEVGPLTWGALLASAPPSATAPAIGNLPQDAIARISALAGASDLARYSWHDRGRAPIGYIKGMAVSFARVYADWKAGESSPRVMAAQPAGDINHDALAWYGVTNITAGASTLRALFSLLIGLGMRESSGNCYEGRDASADNVTADTAEAGLFQQSWNSRAASAELPKLLATWRVSSDDGFLSIFREGLSGSPSQNFGAGDGMAFQHLCKTKPAFAVECAAVGLRTIRQHWGPINRREAEMRPEADALLQQVQAIVDGIVVAPKPPSPPEPPLDGDVLDPVKPPPSPFGNIAALLPLLLIVIKLFTEKSPMANEQTGQPPGQGQGLDLIGKLIADLPKIIAIFQNPTLKKLLNNQPVTFQELMDAVPALLQLLPSHSVPTLEPPKPAEPAAPAEPMPDAAPVVTPPPASPIVKNVSTGVLGVLGAAVTWFLGGMGDTSAILTGAASIAAAALNIPVPVIDLAMDLFKRGAAKVASKPT